MKTLCLLLILSTCLFGHASDDIDYIVSNKGLLTKRLYHDLAKDFTHDRALSYDSTHVSDLLKKFEYNESDVVDFSLVKEDSFTLAPFKKYSRADRRYITYYYVGSDNKRLNVNTYRGRVSANIINDEQDKIKASIDFKYFKSPHKDKRPLIIVFPPIMGNTYLDKTIARKLARQGANVVLVNLGAIFTSDKGVKEVSREFFNTLLLVKVLIQKIVHDEHLKIDKSKVGVFGVSLGGIIAASIAGIVDEVEYAYVLGAGGNLPYISGESERTSVAHIKEVELYTNPIFKGLNKVDQNKLWQEYTTEIFKLLDPLYYASRVDSNKVFMLMSSVDKTVPFHTQIELWNAFGRPEYLLHNMSHISTIVKWMIKDTSHLLKFFLGEANAISDTEKFE